MIYKARMSAMKYVTNLSKMKEINHSDVVFFILFTTRSAVFIDSNHFFLI
jgi:hypothetical protein